MKEMSDKYNAKKANVSLSNECYTDMELEYRREQYNADIWREMATQLLNQMKEKDKLIDDLFGIIEGYKRLNK